MVRSIKLKEDEILFLKEQCNIDVLSKYASKSNYEKKSNSWVLFLETSDMEFITDELLDVLTEKGIANGELNYFGKMVDDFFDKFNHCDS